LETPILLLAASFISVCMGLPMSTLWPARQCCQGADISAKKRKKGRKIFWGAGKIGGRILYTYIKKVQKRDQTFRGFSLSKYYLDFLSKIINIKWFT
jgi:hypothetical protein